jgi:starch synthase
VRVALLSREYPPDVYGGAGVHVEYLARELAKLVDLQVHCFGEPRPAGPPGSPEVIAHPTWDALEGSGRHLGALRTVATDLSIAAGVEDAELVHSHTWYANLAGHLAKLLYGIPHVVSVHSLEPMRPWKVEQLGGGYHVSRFCEQTGIEGADRVIAVSAGMAADIVSVYPTVDPARIQVIHNGIDTDQYSPDHGTDVLEAYGVDPGRPSVIFVGRITRQKVERVRQERGGIVWIEKMLEKREVIQLLTSATVFVCPSVYEPLGIVNLEAMACETAVVATATGGIPEVVVNGETGLLVPFESDGAGGARDPERFAADIAERLNSVLADPDLAERMGTAGRHRAVEQFSWTAIAAETAALYAQLL